MAGWEGGALGAVVAPKFTLSFRFQFAFLRRFTFEARHSHFFSVLFFFAPCGSRRAFTFLHFNRRPYRHAQISRIPSHIHIRPIRGEIYAIFCAIRKTENLKNESEKMG